MSLAGSRPADSHADALQPGFYRRYAQKFGAPSVIVTSPWFSVLDIALPLLVEAVTVSRQWLVSTCPATTWPVALVLVTLICAVCSSVAG
jgi:hypothetical protein